MSSKPSSAHEPYRFDQKGNFVIENYNRTQPFSNFFPGVAGLWGIPMWAFYVNRGQAISSFGIESKDKALLEFLPANKAYRLTSLQGFRTFIKVRKASTTHCWEPFQSDSKFCTMAINSHELQLEDINQKLGLKINVHYFTLPGDSFPALIRRVTLTNISKQKIAMEVIDGLPVIMPYGVRDWTAKNMSRTVEAWVKVDNVKAKAPYYHLNVEVADTPDVKYIKEGNFSFSFMEVAKKTRLLDPIVEAAIVFGTATDYRRPEKFQAATRFILPARQETASRTPSAMCLTAMTLTAHSSQTFTSVFGQTYSIEQLHRIVKRVTAKGYIDAKCAENRQLIKRIKENALTSSSSASFDLYSQQTFLDNILRGGLPITVKTSEGRIAFNVYSRKHGDPERDYNYFVLSPTYFSQGNGNYRDVNQNRRNDVWFNTDVKDSTVLDFWNLIQADGFNPLIVKGMSFYLADPEHLEMLLSELIKGESAPLRELLQNSFGPGDLLKCVYENHLELQTSPQEFLQKILAHCQRQITADHGEGFWSDHWTYNLDLVESYMGVYPDHLRALLLEKKTFSFYHNSHYLVPRTERYFLTEKGVRQYHAVVDGTKEFAASQQGNTLRVRGGQGEVYHTHLFIKMVCLLTNKAASFDPSGVGLEMEGDKPNWYDSLNGLPGLLGSSISETMELKRLAQFLLKHLDGLHFENDSLTVFVELAEFIRALTEIFETEKDPQEIWHKVNDVKEHYRKKIRYGIDGKEIVFPKTELRTFLKIVIDRTRHALDLAKSSEGLVSTYFYHEVIDFALLDKKTNGLSHVLPVAFQRHHLPLFLEGFVHTLKVQHDPQRAVELFRAVRNSALYDRKLKMYKVNADLSMESEEIGRTRIFPRGWLENESIWLHMQYKYLLEILRSGLFKEFYQTFKDVLIPFLKPEVYGRSPLENSSFIVSSAHVDKNMHGQGFVARLSGSTAEFLHIWLLMNIGPRPFHWDNKKGLTLTFRPALAGWLFAQHEKEVTVINFNQIQKTERLPKNSYAFKFLGSTLVVYHNPRRRDTFGEHPATIQNIAITYPDLLNPVLLSKAEIPTQYAQDIRENKVERIDIFLS